MTPIDVIERMRIGAAQRRELPAPTSADTVPAAAWVYAWSQSRHMLPGWYGAGAGFEAVRRDRQLELLRRCYRGWPFFRSLIDDIEAMLARADIDISACYDALAAPEHAGIAAAIRAEFALTCERIAEIKSSAGLLGRRPRRSSAASRCAIPTSIR